MPSYESALLVDQHRVGKTELADASGDLRDLRIGVRAGVPGIGDQALDVAPHHDELAGTVGPPRLLRRPFTASAAVEPLWLTYVKEDWFGVRAASEIKPDERVFTRTACF